MTSILGEKDQPGCFTVSIPEWSLAEDARVLHLGDTFRGWLVLVEAEREPRSAERIQRVRGTATPLPVWAGRLLSHHPVRVDADGAVLWWDAPAPIEGPVELEGWIEANLIDAPPDFPMNQGTIRRMQLEWCDAVITGPGERTVLTERARYDEVETSLHEPSELTEDGPVLTAILVDLKIAAT